MKFIEKETNRVYIQGLHGVPDSWKDSGIDSSEWYWLEGSEKSDNEYHLLKNLLDERHFEVVGGDK
jgi:hypothetical protein